MMAFRRVSEIQPWLVDFLLSDNPRTTGKKLHVLKYVSGPHEDGSIVKLATDLDVSVHVRFTAHALAVFTNTVDSESPDAHEEFNRAFIIVRKYWSSHFPQSDKVSSRFEVVIDDFTLWMIETGFRLKVEPMPCMDVAEVRAKSDRLWTELKLRESVRRDSATDEEETVTSRNEGEPSMSSIPLSQLLDQMGVTSSTPVDEEQENVRGGAFTGKQHLGLLGPSDIPVQLPEDVNTRFLHISQDQKDQLNDIPEWKSSYRPPAVSYVSSCPSTENSAAKSPPAPKSPPALQSSQAEDSLSRPPLPDRPWRKSKDNSARILGTLTTVETLNDQVTTTDMGIGTYGVDVAIQVGDSMLGKSSPGVVPYTEIAAQVGDSLLNPLISDSQSQYVSESQCDFQSQCVFDDVTKVSHNSDVDSSSKSSLDSMVLVDNHCSVTQSQSLGVNRGDEGSSNDQITDTQGQRLVSSREESTETSNSAGSKRNKTDTTKLKRKDTSHDTNTDEESFVTEDSLELTGLAADVGDYNTRVRLSCSESPENVHSFRKSLRRSASASCLEKEKKSESIDDISGNSLKLDQIRRLRCNDSSSDGNHRRSPRLQKEASSGNQSKVISELSDNSVKLGEIQRHLKPVHLSDDNHRRSPRLQQSDALEFGQVQRLRSEDSSDGDYRKSPRLNQSGSLGKPIKSSDENSQNSKKLGQVQRMISEDSSDGDHRRSPRLHQGPSQEKLSKNFDDSVGSSKKLGRIQHMISEDSSDGDTRRSPRLATGPGKASPVGLSKKVADLRDVSVQRSSPRNRQDTEAEEIFGESDDIIMPTPPKISRKGFSPLRPKSTCSNQMTASPLVDLKGTSCSIDTPIIFQGAVTVHHSQDHVPRNLDKQLQAVDTSASAKAAASPIRDNRTHSEVTASSNQEVVAGTPKSSGEEISPARPDQIKPSIPSDPVTTTKETPLRQVERESPSVRTSARRSTTKGPYHSTQISPKTLKELPRLELTLSPIKTQDRCLIDIRRSRGSLSHRAPETDSTASEGSVTEESKRVRRNSTLHSEKTTIESSLCKTPGSSRNSRGSLNQSSVIHPAQTNRVEMEPHVVLERLTPSKYNTRSSGSVITNNEDLAPQSNVGLCHKTVEPEVDITENMAKRSTRRAVSEVREDNKEPSKSPRLNVSTGRRVGRPRKSESQTTDSKDSSKESNKSPLIVTHGRKTVRPRRYEDSPVFASRKERLNVTQSPCVAKGLKNTISSSSHSSNSQTDDDESMPQIVPSRPSPSTPQTPRGDEQRRHTRNDSSSSSVSVNQFYGSPGNSPRWRSPRVNIRQSLPKENIHTKEKSKKSDTPTSKSHKANAESPLSHHQQRKYSVTRKNRRQPQVLENSTSLTGTTSGEDEQSDAPIAKATKTRSSKPTQKALRAVDTLGNSSKAVTTSMGHKAGPHPIITVSSGDDSSSIVIVDDGAKPQSDDEDFNPSPFFKKKVQDTTYKRTPSGRRGSLQKKPSETHLQKTTPRRTPRTPKPKQKRDLDGDAYSTSSDSTTTEVNRKVQSRHTRKKSIPDSVKVPEALLGEEGSDEEIAAGSSIEEIEDGTSVQSEDEYPKHRSTQVKKKLQSSVRKPTPSKASSVAVVASPEQKGRSRQKTKSAPSKLSQTAVELSDNDSSIAEVDDEEDETQTSDEDYIPEYKTKGKKADMSKHENTNRKRRHCEPSPHKNLGKTKRSSKSQKMTEIEDSDVENASDDEVFKPSPRKKMKGQPSQLAKGRQRRTTLKESTNEESEDEKDEDYDPSDNDDEYRPSPGAKLNLPLDRKGTRKYQDRTKLSLSKKTAAKPKKRAAKKAMTALLGETGRIEIIHENTTVHVHNPTALFSASKKSAAAKVKQSSTRKRKLFSEQTLLGEPLSEVPEEVEKPAKGCNLRLNLASPLKPILPKLSGKRQVYDLSDDSDLLPQTSDKSSSSILNDDSTQQKNSVDQEKGTAEEPNSPSHNNIAEEEGDAFLVTTPVSSLPSHQPVTDHSSHNGSPDGSDQQQKDNVETATNQENVTAAEQGKVQHSDSDPEIPEKAASSPTKRQLSVSTPTKSLPSDPVTPTKAANSPSKRQLHVSVSTPTRPLPSDPVTLTKAANSPSKRQLSVSTPTRPLPSDPVTPTRSPGKRRVSVLTPMSSQPSDQPEEPVSLMDTPIKEEIKMILSSLPKDPPACPTSPLTDMDMPQDLITKLSHYFASDEFA